MAVHVCQRRQDRSRPRRSFPPQRALHLEALEDRSLLSYSFVPIAFIPGAAPGGGSFINDFEPFAINKSGKIAFVADVTTGGEGIFTGSAGQLAQIVRTGQGAPGGGTFDFGDLGHVALNNNGDGAFAFFLSPQLQFPIGRNAGVYRFAQNSRVTPVVVPGQTKAPGGATFVGVNYDVSLNNRGDLSFTGMVPASIGPGAPIGLGFGDFVANSRGQITTVARPGDPAPGGSTFDYAWNSWINDNGDVAFEAHVASDPILDFHQTLPTFIFTGGSVYKKTADGTIQSIAHQGQPAPGGGTYLVAFAPVLNNAGQLLFIGDLGPSNNGGKEEAVFLNSGGTTLPVARQGDPMPGGGSFVTASSFAYGGYSLNNLGDLAFIARLDNQGIGPTGLYVRSGGTLQLVARTGSVIPNVGTVAQILPPIQAKSQGSAFYSPVAINDLGQICFQVTLTDGTGVLLVATPTSGGGAPANIGDPGIPGQENDATLAVLLTRDLGNPEGFLVESWMPTPIQFLPQGDQPATPLPGRQDPGATSHGALVGSSSNSVHDRLYADVEDQLLDRVFVEDLGVAWVER